MTPALRAVTPWLYAIPAAVLSYALLILTLGVMTWAGRHFYTRAWAAFRHHSADMNTLIAVGTGAAFVYSVIATVVSRVEPPMMALPPGMGLVNRALDAYWRRARRTLVTRGG